ncbi:MAG: hypothetical protein HY815_11855 [Candidatus Riflebacteria bacterium]|nr:hypothetical protein [Candidatus Riflebacteria bacterium]
MLKKKMREAEDARREAEESVLRRELQIKRLSRREKLALIAGARRGRGVGGGR